MKLNRHHLELSAMSACTNILMEETKGLGQKACKGSRRGCFMFESCLLSKKSAEEAISIGVDLIVVPVPDEKNYLMAITITR